MNLVSLIKSKIFQHLSFWVLAFVILSGIFGKEYNGAFQKVNLVYTLLFISTLLPVVYINLKILIPKLISSNRWILYGASVVLLLAAGVVLNWLMFEFLADIFLPGFYFISYYEVLDLTYFFLVFLAVSMVLKFAKAWFELDRQKKYAIQLKSEKLRAEIDALKAQIHPHFLFNSLNNIYVLALDQDQKVPDLLLRLSNSMRYMLYDTKEDFVYLEKELDYVKDYMAFQKLRTIHQSAIKFDVEGAVLKQKIAPLVFAPFIENAFKHGVEYGADKNVFVDIKINIGTTEIQFYSKNRKSQKTVLPDFKAIGGIGLENVRKRLDLLYSDSYILEIKDEADFFTVNLKLPVR